jgi:hypothetical protein
MARYFVSVATFANFDDHFLEYHNFESKSEYVETSSKK